jgi:hypothetical protein
VFVVASSGLYILKYVGSLPLSVITKLCDVNRDSVVDILDFVIVGKYFGCKNFPSEYNPDVNRDGKVDILDLAFVGKNFE